MKQVLPRLPSPADCLRHPISQPGGDDDRLALHGGEFEPFWKLELPLLFPS